MKVNEAIANLAENLQRKLSEDPMLSHLDMAKLIDDFSARAHRKLLLDLGNSPIIRGPTLNVPIFEDRTGLTYSKVERVSGHRDAVRLLNVLASEHGYQYRTLFDFIGTSTVEAAAMLMPGYYQVLALHDREWYRRVDTTKYDAINAVMGKLGNESEDWLATCCFKIIDDGRCVYMGYIEYRNAFAAYIYESTTGAVVTAAIETFNDVVGNFSLVQIGPTHSPDIFTAFINHAVPYLIARRKDLLKYYEEHK